MKATQGHPSKKDMGAIPERTKSHSVPRRKEMKHSSNKMKVNEGPSHKGMGAIPHKTKSHMVPGREEMMGGQQGDGMMMPQPQSGADRLSPDPQGSMPSKFEPQGGEV